MKEINQYTKRGQQLLEMARRNEGFALSDVYGNPSYSKCLAYGACLNEALQEGDATTFRICSHNSFSFTCAWNSKDGVRFFVHQVTII